MKKLENIFSWSKSRDALFNECRRKYYYNHYGFWGGWEDSADRRTRQIYVLKNLQSRYVWLGSVVHEYIHQLLDQVRYGHDVDLYRLCGRLKKTMEQDFRNSETGRYVKYPKIRGRRYGLFEHEYDFFLSKQEWGEVFGDAELCVTNFFNSDLFRYIKSVDVENWLPLERLQCFDFEGTRVYVKLDFALRDGEKLIIFDWKTGRVRDIDADIQLACYALYSKEKWGIDPEDIVCKTYNLRIDKVDDYEINDGVIERTRDYMRDSIKSMKELLYDVGGNVAREEDFVMREDRNKCKYCNFKKMCKLF